MNQLDLFLPCAAGVEHCLAQEVRSLVADPGLRWAWSAAVCV